MVLRTICAKFLAVGLSFIGSISMGQLTAPRTQDRQIARVVSLLLPQQHVSHAAVDDRISQRAIKLFLKSLDPMKLYFLQADATEFAGFTNKVDDLVNAGDLSLAYTVFNRFLERVDQRAGMAQQILEQPLNFDDEEMMVIEPDAAQYPSNDEEARDRMRRQIEYSVLAFKDDKKTELDAVETLKRRCYRRSAAKWHQFSGDDLLELFLTSVTSSFDPHTTYMSPDSFEDFKIQMRLNLEGIGAALMDKDGFTVISKVIPGGAADKHGKIKAEDFIVSVGQGNDGPMSDIVDMNLRDVVKLIRGPAGTTVRLGVKTGGVGETEVHAIGRAKVELEDSAARSEILLVPTSDGAGELKIGYIDLPSFYMDMDAASSGATDFKSGTRDVRLLLEKFRANKVDGVMLDLRINGGGSLSEAISLTGLFIDRGPVVQVKEPDGKVRIYPDDVAGTSWDGPLVVVTSKFSASASEIFAGAIQDYNRGLVVGDVATHGKGSVQTLMDLGDSLFGNQEKKYGALKLTIQQYFLPDGESVQKRGVPADVILPSLTQHMDVGEADMDYALEYSTVQKANHRMLGLTPPDVVASVRAQSATRIEKNSEFKELLRRVEIYRKQKDEKFVSLNRAKFEARRKELDAQKEEEKELLDQQNRKEEVFKHNFYNDETLNVTRDYVELLRRQNLARVK